MAYRDRGRNIFCEVLNCDLINLSGSSATGTGSAGQQLDPVLGWRDAIGFAVRKGADQSIPNGTSTTVAPWSVAANTHDYFSASFNTTTGTFTVPRTGIWCLTGSVGYAANATGGRNVQITKTSGAENLPATYLLSQGAGGASCAVTTYVGRLVAGETYQLQTQQDSGGALSLVAAINYTRFSAVFLGAAASTSSPE